MVMWHMLECGTCASLAAHRYIRIILKNVNGGLGKRSISPGRCAGKLCKIGVDAGHAPNLGSLPGVFKLRPREKTCGMRTGLLRESARPAI